MLKKFRVHVEYEELEGYIIVEAFTFQDAVKHVFEKCDVSSGITWTNYGLASLNITGCDEIK